MIKDFLAFRHVRRSCGKRVLAPSCLSVCPYVLAAVCSSSWNKSSSTGRIFTKFFYMSIFLISVEKIQISLNLRRVTGTLHENIHIIIIIIIIIYRWIILRMISVSNFVAKIKTHILFWYFADRASQYIYLNINQLDVLNFIVSLFHASTCFEHKCSSSGGQNYTIQSLVSSHL